VGPYSMFVEYQANGSIKEIKEGPVLLKGKTEREASEDAIAKADWLYPMHASYVLIRVIGSDGSGRPIAEIRRPISN
jgi:hypothetical protein